MFINDNYYLYTQQCKCIVDLLDRLYSIKLLSYKIMYLGDVNKCS